MKGSVISIINSQSGKEEIGRCPRVPEALGLNAKDPWCGKDFKDLPYKGGFP